MDVTYVYQELDKIPDGYQVPEGRVKPVSYTHLYILRLLRQQPYGGGIFRRSHSSNLLELP